VIKQPTVRHRAKTAATGLITVLASLGLAGCQAPVPTITWYGNETAVSAGPRLYCTLTAQPQPDCRETAGPIAVLDLHADDLLQVNIPPEVAKMPWLLVYSYVDDTSSYRTPVMTDGTTLSYVVHPVAGRQLQQVDLQVLTLSASPQGQPQYTPLQAWVLQVRPA
jgi:hypothetical protein